MCELETNEQVVEYIEETLSKINLIEEHRLYREEQYQDLEEVIIVRNSLNWIIRLNKLIKFFKYSYINAFKNGKKIKMPLEETEYKEWYSFHLENALYRLLVIWDVYAQLLNEFYKLGLERKRVSIWKVKRKLDELDSKKKIIGKLIDNYCNGENHQFVRNYLRNDFAHNLDPHGGYIFHHKVGEYWKPVNIDDFLTEHPLKELLYIINDFKKVYGFISNLNSERKEIVLNNCILINLIMETECEEEVNTINNIKFIEAIKESNGIGIPADKENCISCKYMKNRDGKNYCEPKKLKYHRINESKSIMQV